MSHIPLPDSPSPTSTDTLSWPGSSSSAGAKEDQALLQHEVIEAVAEVAQLASEGQTKSPLVTTSRDLAPIETTSAAEQGEEVEPELTSEAETPTQVFQTPVSPSHTAVDAYRSAQEVGEEEPSELPFLAAESDVGGGSAEVVESVAIKKDDTVKTVDQDEIKAEDPAPKELESTAEEVAALSNVKPAVQNKSTAVIAAVLSEEELDEIKRSPIQPPVHLSPWFSTSFAVTMPVLTPNGWQIPPHPNQRDQATLEEFRRMQARQKRHSEQKKVHQQQQQTRRSEVLVPSVGVASSEDSSSEDERLLHPRNPPILADAAPSYTRLSVRPAVGARAPPPPPPVRRAEHPTDHSRRTRTIVSSVRERQAVPAAAPRRSEVKKDLPKSTLSTLELVNLLKARLKEDETFHYVIKGVMMEFEEGRKAIGGDGESAPKEVRQPKEARGAHQVHTDSESEIEIEMKKEAARRPERKTDSPPPRRHALGSFPMTRSPIVVPASFVQTRQSAFHDPRDISIAKKPTSARRHQQSTRPRSMPIHPLSTTLPPLTPSSSEEKPFEPRSATLALEEAARKAEENERMMARLVREQGGPDGRKVDEKRKMTRKGDEKSGPVDGRRTELRPADGRKGQSKAADGRKSDHQRSSKDQHKSCKDQPKRGEVGPFYRPEMARRPPAEPKVDFTTKISMLGRPGGPQYPGQSGQSKSAPSKSAPAKSAPSTSAEPLRVSTNRLSASRQAPKSAGAVLSKGGFKAGEKGSKSNVASFDFDDFL